MTFGQNYLSLLHRPSQKAWAFTTEQALKCVKNGEMGDGDGGVKVGYADKWLQSRTDPFSTTPMPMTVPTKPYDWTYTTTYTGHETVLDPDVDIAASSSPPEPSDDSKIGWIDADPEDPTQIIPLAELSRPDPILFYAEIPLFEDELHDNGSSSLLVRIVEFSVLSCEYQANLYITARYANMFLHTLPIYPSRRQRSLQDF